MPPLSQAVSGRGGTDTPSGRSDRGASLIEFALLMPLLILLILGIVELGFLLGQFNEVRHGAHEGARLAAVNDASAGANTCNAMSLDGNSTVNVDFTDSTNGEIGEQGSVTVTLNVSSLSGLSLITIFLPSTVSNKADFRLEQPSSNWDSSNQDQTPCP